MGRQTIWRSIAETLQAEIGSGSYKPGARLPTEAELSTRFGVNRHTVRQAIAHLVEAGLLRSRRGSGVFVESQPTDYSLGRRVRFHQNVAGSGRAASRRQTRLETLLASPHEAEQLGLAEGAMVHVYEGVTLLDAQPIACFRSIFDAERFPDLLSHLAEDPSITAALRRHGLADYTRQSTRLTAKIARGPLALLLEVQEGAPILRTDSVNIDAEGRAVELGRTWFAGDRITLVVQPEDGPLQA